MQKRKALSFAVNGFWNKNGLSLKYKNKLYNENSSWEQVASEDHVLKNNLFIAPGLNSLESEIMVFGRPLTNLSSFQLQNISPLINAGVGISSKSLEFIRKAFWGNKLSKPGISIGAHQR